MNAEVVATDSALTVLNRHIAHMAESAISQQQTSSSASSSTSTVPAKSVEECWAQGQHLMSLWRPIVCRNSQMFPPPTSSSSSSSQANRDSSYLNSTPSGDPPSVVNHSNKVVKSAESSATLANSKSIPVHCVVMNTTTPCYLSDAVMTNPSGGMRGGGGGVDGTAGAAGTTSGGLASGANNKAASGSAAVTDEVDVDSYAIIPASTLFTQIVPVVLRKLGYSDDIIFNATGWLTMKNWRPLALTQIASSDRETVGGVLGELTTVATLRIYIRKNQSNNSGHHSEMKDKVLRWLISQNQHVMNSNRFPLDEKWQQKVMRGERPNTPSPDTLRQFDNWFQQEMSRPTPPQHQQQHHSSRMDKTPSRISPADNLAASAGLTATDGQSREVLPPRVRMRTTFDPEQELPRLQRWFSENQHPTRFQLQLFVQELNELDSRRGRKPLDVSNLVYWFKNARAAYKRAEVRNNQNESSNNPDCWMGGQSLQGCTGEESSDDNRRMEDDEAGLAGEEDDDSSVSDRSNRSFDQRLPPTLKLEPVDLNRSSDDQDCKEQERQLDSSAAVDPLNAGEDDDDIDDDGASHPSDSESDMEDYAENLSLSKSATDGDGKKVDDPLLPTSASSSQSDYGGGGTAGYPGFPLSLSHAQLNPHGLVYMTSPYLQGISSSLLHHHHHHSSSAHLHGHHRASGMDPLSLTAGNGGGSSSCDDRRKRNRTFIDPVTEVPRLEHWFSLNTHPSHSLVLRYTEELNRQPYRLKFPKLEPKNVQFWFKNRRAKCKRLKLSL